MACPCRREADKRRLLQHRKERLSYDPRMPARLAAFPCHAPCTFMPPYALMDPAAPTPTTALNVDGDGWSPMVDVVRLECPSPSLDKGDTPSSYSAMGSDCQSRPQVCEEQPLRTAYQPGVCADTKRCCWQVQVWNLQCTLLWKVSAERS